MTKEEYQIKAYKCINRLKKEKQSNSPINKNNNPNPPIKRKSKIPSISEMLEISTIDESISLRRSAAPPPGITAKVIDFIDYWNTLDNVQHHKDLSKKVVSRSAALLKSLQRGDFGKKFPIDEVFMSKHKIESFYLSKKFSDLDIKNGMKGLSLLITEGYGYDTFGNIWPDTSYKQTLRHMSLADLIYKKPHKASNTQYEKPISWFLRVFASPPQPIGAIFSIDGESKKFLNFYNQVLNILSIPPTDKDKKLLSQKIKRLIYIHSKIDFDNPQKMSRWGDIVVAKSYPNNFIKEYLKYVKELYEYNDWTISVKTIGVGTKSFENFLIFLDDEFGVNLKYLNNVK